MLGCKKETKHKCDYNQPILGLFELSMLQGLMSSQVFVTENCIWAQEQDRRCGEGSSSSHCPSRNCLCHSSRLTSEDHLWLPKERWVMCTQKIKHAHHLDCNIRAQMATVGEQTSACLWKGMCNKGMGLE